MIKKRYLICVTPLIIITFLVILFSCTSMKLTKSAINVAVKKYASGADSEIIFMKEIIKHPKLVGAVAPSSDVLSSRTVSYIDNTQENIVVEIGAGTGSFTKFLVKKIKKDNLFITEINSEFVKFLKKIFPKHNVLQANATVLDQKLPKNIVGKVDFVVSSLPMTIFSIFDRDKIINSCLKALKPSGKILQITYKSYSPIDSDRYNLNAKRLAYIEDNLPAAYIWQYTKK